MSRPKPLFTGLLIAALLGAASCAYYRAQARQAATLSRITALETHLIASNKQRKRFAKNTLLGIATAVGKNHNQAHDMVVLQHAKEIEARSNGLLDTLHQLRQYWQAAGQPRELRQLPTQLNQYVAFIRNFLPDVPMQLATANWLANFDAADPKPSALAQLTKLETQVRKVESEALERQVQQMAFEYVFDKIGAFVAPASTTVAPGSVYQAQLMLVQSISTERIHFSADGREVPINPTTGQALVQFKVPAARPGQPDTVRAEWHGRVQLPWATGDTVLETTVPYFIVKPTQR
jgi:hypothetical protein